ncbi:MAG TPA: choice-of-anchor X domain-containing protein [Pyrinomonadaceae bacterium]|jgi:pimeloyl-ACP methyl ester carboxylesterase|nr:choice-of-anchor X domain-containing protein [Pyrinomonadaceae bacterium]
MRNSLHTSDLIRRAASLLLAAAFLFEFAGQAAAQTRRRGGAAVRTSAPSSGGASVGSSCGWRGSVEVNRSTSHTHTKATAKGEHQSDQYYSGKQSVSSSFNYYGRFDVGNSPGETSEEGRFSATLRGTFEANAERVMEQRENSTTELECFPDPPRTVTVNGVTTVTDRGKREGTIDDGTLVIDEGGRYFFSFSFPDLDGKSTTKTQHSATGYCLKENDQNHDETHEGASSFSSEAVRGEGAIDPKNPNVLRGEFRPDEDTLVTWNLFKPEGDCDEFLTVRELRLAHHPFPNKTAWAEIDGGTIDGNQVQLLAVVENKSKQEKSVAVTFKELTTGAVLETRPVSVPAKGEAEVEVVWDTNGFAWTDEGEKAPQREVEARLATGDSVSEKVHVSPKPVIMVHGLWSNAAAWSEYQSYLNEAHSFAWRGWAVGANPGVAIMNTGDHPANHAPTNTIAQNAEQLGKQINAVQAEQNAWHVDLVAHSMGGLISRFYIHSLMATDSPDKRPYVTHLVMLGTPNEGSPCAYLTYPTYKAAGFHVEALRQLMPIVVWEFNREVTNRKGVQFSILAGVPVPRTCSEKTAGDGVVSVPSALWKVDDSDWAPRIHTALTGRRDFFSFVKPRLAVGPKKAKESAAPGATAGRAWDSVPDDNLVASLRPVLPAPAPATPQARILLSKALKVGPGQSAEVPVQIGGKGDAGVTFVAPPAVKVSLVGADGTAREPAEAAGPFQTFYPEDAGSWTLRFENGGDAEAAASATVWANEPVSLAVEFTELQRQADGGLRLQAKVTAGPEAVKGAVVSVRLDGQPNEISLRDDGKHGDGAPGDGLYGATTGKTRTGETFVEVKAFSNGVTATAAAFVTAGAR